MNVEIEPMRVEISASEGQRYKSITSLVWDAVPGLAVLTGRNGSGKTQLLELLAHHFTGTFPPGSKPEGMPVTVSVSGAAVAEDEVGFIPSAGRFSGASSASVGGMAGQRQNLLQQADNVYSYRNDPIQSAKSKRMARLLGGRDWRNISGEELDELFPDDYSSLLVDVDVVASLATIFMAYRLKTLEAIDLETPGIDRNGNDLGPPPWEVVNDSLKVAGFPYEVISPKSTKITENYDLRLRDISTGAIIQPHSLSSGEQVLLQLILWLFAASKGGNFPKLLLLDEPDAHLHPSMTVQFLDVISEVLVQKYGVRVIMTTHSPSTVALAPEGSIFQMTRGSEIVEPVVDRAAMISILTAGLITVSSATKFCFVEDDEDVAFYNAVRDLLTDYGPRRDRSSLKPVPSLVFVAASVGKGSQKISGGSSVVAKWVAKLDAEPLTHTFLGVIDADNGAVGSARIKVLGRYSFENYLLDPLNVFGLLLENNSAPQISGMSISSGDEHQLWSASDATLQSIAFVVANQAELVEPALKTASTAQITYTTGQSVTVPEWIVRHRGHDLLPIMQRAWGGPKLINPPRLIQALRRVRLIPQDLADVFASLQDA